MSGKPLVFLVCTGLGYVNRGYESFTRECFDHLTDNDSFQLFLLKGGGKSEAKEKVVWNIPRNSKLSKWIHKITGNDSYVFEQVSFFIGMLPLLLKHKPSVIFYSDFQLGTYLWHLRRFLRFKYKLLFSNGAPNGPPFTRMDHVQQLLPDHYRLGLQGGTTEQSQTLLPYAIRIDKRHILESLNNKLAIRKELGLPGDKKIVLTVGALNKKHKRMDYVIDEVAELGPSYFLVLLGQHDEETPSIIEQAEKKLSNNFLLTSLPQEMTAKYYLAADYFVLASLKEGLPRVIPEALSFGLPCFVHDYTVTREILQEHGNYGDFTKKGKLEKLIAECNDSRFLQINRINHAYNSYSWDVLKPGYIELIKKSLIDRLSF